jgi:hypothetical protein
MSTNRFAVSIFLSLLLAGCGTYVPDIQEFPGDSADGQRLVTAIVRNVKCEVQDALDDLYRIDSHPFLDGWGVQIALNLTMIEKSTANPTAIWMPVSPITSVFTLGAGATLSSEATRTEKLSSYYTVRQLRRLGRCNPEARGGPFLLQSNLKLNEWLVDAVTAGNTGGVDYHAAASAFKDGVLSHEVKFDVTTSGDITPSWKLVTGSINPSGTFLAASRDRSHDLTITFGPTDASAATGPHKGKPVPSRAAADAALASDIGVSVGNAIKRALRP